jgi:hypothetical protein
MAQATWQRTSEVAMPTDIILEDQDLTLDAADARLHVKAADVTLASGARQSKPGARRALVHSVEDGLVVNFNGDYPGGVEIHGARVTVHGLLFAGSPSSSAVAGGGAGPPIGDDDEPHVEGLVEPELDPDAVFGDLDHTAPFNVVLELRLLRAAVRRLHDRLELLESKP